MTTRETTPTMSSPPAIRERLRNYTRDVGLLPETVLLQMRTLVEILRDEPCLGRAWAGRLDPLLTDALHAISELNNEKISGEIWHG